MQMKMWITVDAVHSKLLSISNNLEFIQLNLFQLEMSYVVVAISCS